MRKTATNIGMGRALVELLAPEGAKVVSAHINQARLDEVVEAEREAGGEIVGVIGNSVRKADSEKIVDVVMATSGWLDILCHYAGVHGSDGGGCRGHG